MLKRLSLLLAGLLVLCTEVHAFNQEPDRNWVAAWPMTDFSQSDVAFSEVFSGGVPKDGIPSIDSPQFVPIADAEELASNAPVMSLEIEGDARAYPLAVLIWHEIVNDTVGGLPVAITYCPLCNSGVVFERTVDGEMTTFGTTGKLRNSDLIMYDRATESWWQQFEGRAIIGARLGTELVRVPARLESFADFQTRFPDGQVLVPNDPRMRDYGRNPYAGYDSAARPFLYRGDYDGPGRPLMRVVHVHGRDDAWSMELLRKETTITVDDLTLTWREGQASALDTPQIADGRDVGTVIAQRTGADGALKDVPYDVPFAFAFKAFLPSGTIHHVSE